MFVFFEKKNSYFYYTTFVIVFILLSLFSRMNNCQEKGQDKNCKYTDYPVRFRSIFHKNLFKIVWRSYQKVKFCAIKPNCAFNYCIFLKGKGTWKTTWKKNNKNINKTITIYRGNAGPASIKKVKSTLTELQIHHVNNICMFYGYNVFLVG